MTLLGSLLEMGGEGLRVQLIADLRHAEQELETCCMVERFAEDASTQHMAQVLHSLRGLAMTIGAHQLTAACRHAEELGDDVSREALVASLSQVLQQSASTRDAISRYGRQGS